MVCELSLIYGSQAKNVKHRTIKFNNNILTGFKTTVCIQC